MSRPIPTAQIISALAGVSKSTVSRALVGDERISAGTRERVRAVADQLGYMPNAIARSLVTRRSGIVGYVVGQTENLFFQEQLERVAAIAGGRGVQLMLFQVPSGGDLADIVPKMLEYRLDGCIVIASVPVSANAVETCARYRMPLVLLNRLAPETAASSVLCDNVEGGRMVGTFLLAGGHDRIAFVSGRPGSPISQDREDGLIAALAAAGRRPIASRIGHFSFEGGREAGLALVERDRPDAVFAASDVMAFGVIEALQAAGLRVPDDVSVVGFDGARAGAWAAYDLTTIVQPVEAMFRRAIDLLENRNADATQPAEAVHIRPSFLLRGSARQRPKAA